MKDMENENETDYVHSVISENELSEYIIISVNVINALNYDSKSPN